MNEGGPNGSPFFFAGATQSGRQRLTAPVTPARYQSFGLRYDLKRSGETRGDFFRRINRLERGDEVAVAAEPDARWMFGSQSVAAGSLHCDVWTGPAAELAARDLLAVRPVSGWWRSSATVRSRSSAARTGRHAGGARAIAASSRRS